jgi:hypothetical protein
MQFLVREAEQDAHFVSLRRAQAAHFPTGIENDLLKIAAGVCVTHFVIGGNHGLPVHQTCDDPGVQARLRVSHLSVGKTLLHKSGKAETDDLRHSVSLQFDKRASGRVGHLEELTPSLEGSRTTDRFRSILGGMQPETFR